MVWKSLYKPVYDNIQGKITFRIGSAAITWILLGLIIALHNHGSPRMIRKFRTRGDAFLVGALSGFIVYGVYNFTNYSTLTHYTLKLAVLDTLWGTFAFGVVSALLLH